MHTFIFPSKDTYITNLSNLENKNFGIDELLNISCVASIAKSVIKYQSGSLDSSDSVLNNLVNFYGTVNGYYSGSTTNIILSNTSTDTTVLYGSVVGVANPTSSWFTGNLTGSVSGYVTSALLNGNTYTTQTISLTNASGSVTNLSGSLSGSVVSGNVSGSLAGLVTVFSGSLYGISGTLEGDISGSYAYYNPKFSFNTYSKFSRALIKFDVNAISSSISSGDISDPKFVLNMKVLQQKELPLEYIIYSYLQSFQLKDRV